MGADPVAPRPPQVERTYLNVNPPPGGGLGGLLGGLFRSLGDPAAPGGAGGAGGLEALLGMGGPQDEDSEDEDGEGYASAEGAEVQARGRDPA